MSKRETNRKFWNLVKTTARELGNQYTDQRAAMPDNLYRAAVLLKDATIDDLRCNDESCTDCSNYTVVEFENMMFSFSSRLMKLSKYLEKRYLAYHPHLSDEIAKVRQLIFVSKEMDMAAKNFKAKRITAKEYLKLSRTLTAERKRLEALEISSNKLQIIEKPTIPEPNKKNLSRLDLN